jgi:hypothetical protein
MSGSTYDSSISTQLPVVPNTSDPELYKELVPVYDAIRALNVQIGGSSTLCTATENLAPGDIVQVYGVAGTLSVRKASAASASIKEANGYVSAQSSVLSGVVTPISIFRGIAIMTGLTVGTKYYLSAVTPGTVTTVAPAGPNLIQAVGIAISTTELAVSISLA